MSSSGDGGGGGGGCRVTCGAAARGQPAPLTPRSTLRPAQWQQMVPCLSDGEGLGLNSKICSAFSAPHMQRWMQTGF